MQRARIDFAELTEPQRRLIFRECLPTVAYPGSEQIAVHPNAPTPQSGMIHLETE